MKQVYIKTFGCQMNVYDSARMRDALRVLGYHETDDKEQADILLLNTCHIREKAAEKLYSEIGRLREVKQRRRTQGLDTTLIVAGCVVQAEGQGLLDRAPAVDIAVGPQNYHRLPELLWEHQRKRGRVILADFPAESKFDALPPPQTSAVSAFLAIQEGCDHFCTYCVVPYTRGCEYSRPTADILREAGQLVKAGAREIMLLGQNVNCWHGEGADGKGVSDLGDLIRKLAAIKGLKRIRYTTSYPSEITRNLIEAHRDVPALMPAIHLPIQSGSDAVLKAMNRLYSAAAYEEIIARFQEARPDMAFSSDFIVGFPGETDKDFEQTLAVIRRVRYTTAYSFKFSARPGTPASLMKKQIPENVKDERLRCLQTLLLEQQKQANQRQVGRTLPVLFAEKGRAGQLVGYTPYMQATHAAADESLLGQIADVRILQATATSLTGAPIDKKPQAPQQKGKQDEV